MRLSHLLMALVLCVVWGLNAVAGKIGVTYIPPVFFTALRFVFVMMLLAPWLKPVPGQWNVLIPAVFFMGGLHFALIFSGVKLSDASTMSIVNQLYVPISVLLAMVWLDETVPLRRWLGIALAFCGVIVFSLDANVASHLMGVFLLFLDAISMGIGTVPRRRLLGSPARLRHWPNFFLSIPRIAAASLSPGAASYVARRRASCSTLTVLIAGSLTSAPPSSGLHPS